MQIEDDLSKAEKAYLSQSRSRKNSAITSRHEHSENYLSK